MPLAKVPQLDIHIPYDAKLAIFERKCKGCGFLKGSNDADGVFIGGCSYPTDLLGINKAKHPPYLSPEEIASNGCIFWFSGWDAVIDNPDCSEGDYNDPIVKELLNG